MKKLITLLSLVVMLPLVLVSQTTGDYRSAVNNGNWGTAATWETFNGSTWDIASSQPGATNDVTIRNGFDVVLDASGKNCKNLTIETGATFKANLALPTSSIRYVRINGTTATINGTFGDATTGDAISMENANNGGTVTITGTGTFAPARLRVNTAASGSTTIFDIDTKFMYTGSTGTGGVALYPQTDNNTFTVNAGKTLTFVDNAGIAVGSSASGTSDQAVTFNVHGTIDLSQPNSNLNLRTIGPGSVKMATLNVSVTGVVNIGGNLLTTTVLNNGGSYIIADGSITVNGTADFPDRYFVMIGSGTFSLGNGGEINIGSPFGLDASTGQIRTSTRSFSTNATYILKSDSAQVTGTDFPSHVNYLVIQSDTVTISKNVEVDSLVVDSTAMFATSAAETLRVNNAGDIGGTLINRRSIITNDTLTFKNGSKYVHAVNGAGIPLGFWEMGSTIELTGITGNAPSNGNQNFYNVVWNSPAQASNLNLGWNGNTIGGDITVISTGASRWQMCAPTAGNSATVIINGDVNVSGGQFTTNGTSNGNTTIVINHYGDVNVTGGNFSISRGSQGGTGTSTWNLLNGNFSMSNAATQNSNPVGAKFVFTKEGTQTLTLGSGNTLTALPIEIDSGTTLAMGSSVVLGSGIFTLEATAGIEVQHPAGLDSTLLNTGTKTLSKGANYIYNGATAQQVGLLLPDTVNSLTISNPAGVTIVDTFKVGELNITVGALLRIDSLGILAADTGAVDGTIWNKDSISTLNGFIFGNGSVYEHARNAGVIPTGMWGTGSTIKITGLIGNSPSNGNQNFYNVVWNSPNQASNLNLGWNGNVIGGNITVENTGASRWQMCAPAAGETAMVTLNGEVIVTGGAFSSNGTSNANTVVVINQYGNVNVTGGNFSVSRGSQGSGTGSTRWYLFGDFIMQNATTQNSNPTNAWFVFAKQGAQTVNLTDVTFAGGGLPMVVKSGSTLQLETSVIRGSGIFTLDSGATIQTANASGLDSSLKMTGVLSLSKNGNYSFNGTMAQVTGLLLPDTLNNLTINDSLGVTLSRPTVINGVLALKKGVFNNTIPFTLGPSGSISYEGGSLLWPLVWNVVSVSEARKDANADLIPDHSITGDTIKVYGVVTSPNYQTTNTSYYIQDDSAGINVFKSGTVMNFEIGDSVFVIGTVLQFNGLTEISPLAADSTFFGVIKQNAVIPAPKQLTLAQFLAAPEMYESQMIRIDTLYKSSGSWPAAGSSASIYLKKMSGTDSLQLRIDSDTEIDGSPEPQYPINLVGIASQFSSGATVYNNGYQILPRDTADIWHVIVVGVAEEFENVPIEYKLYQNYPNPFNPTTTIKFTVAKAGMARVKIYNAIGQEVVTIFNQIAEPGKYYSVQLNASRLSSGMYFSVFESENHREIKKMMLLK